MADTLKQAQTSQRRFADHGIQLSRVFFVIGMMMLVLTLFMFPPAVSDLVARNDDWQVFAASAFVTGFLGLMLVLVSRGGWSEHVSR